MFFFKSNISVLEACELIGVEVPRFCYHQSLSVAGNCRMCLVELSNSPKPVASCALLITRNIKISTDSPLVKKARENIVEFLLLNHPLDCPICDQGGECDLQDQARLFGIKSSRFFINKRSVEDKYCNSLIKTIMSRCIHCTRCVRFNAEISGNSFLGTLARGGSTEIGPYLDLNKKFYNSEMSGNIIDICPVGALTSSSYTFKSRPWEIRTFESLDLTDGFSSRVYVCLKETEIIRIYPKLCYETNNQLISDKARFSYDFNKNNRLINSYTNFNILKNKSEIRTLLSIENTFNLKPLFLSHNDNDLDSLLLTKNLENKFFLDNKVFLSARNVDFNLTTSNLFINWVNDTLFCSNTLNTRICLILSCNIRLESSLLNTKLRIKHNQKFFSIFGFGLNFKNTFDMEFLNLNLDKICFLFESKNLKLGKLLLKQISPLIIFGETLFKRGCKPYFLNNFIKNILRNALVLKINISSNLVGTEFLNTKSLNTRLLVKTQALYLLNPDDSCLVKKFINNFYKKDFCLKKIFYFTTHKSSFEMFQDFDLKKIVTIIPSMTNWEEDSVYINFEQRIQKTTQILKPLNSKIFCIKEMLYDIYNNNIIFGPKPYTKHLFFFKELARKKELFFTLKLSKKFNFINLNFFQGGKHFLLSEYPIQSLSEDFFLSNKNLSNSKIMQKCSSIVTTRTPYSFF